MQDRFLVLCALICVTNSYVAASSSNSPASFEGTVYALCNPTDNISLQVDTRKIDRKELALQMAQGEVVSNRLTLKNNALYVDDCFYWPISVCVAGGYPKGDTDQEKYEYEPAERFFVLYKDVGYSGTNMHNRYPDLQKCEHLAAVIKHISKSKIPAIVIDLQAWLNVAYGAKQEQLPVRMVPCRPSPWCRADFTTYEPKALTQAQLDERQRRDEARLAAPVRQWLKELIAFDWD